MNPFLSQTATNREQSERLIAIGIKPKTADMYWSYDGNPYLITYTLKVVDKLVPATLKEDDIPAWSLSRLIEMLPCEIPDPKPGYPSHHPELIKHKSGYNLSIRRYTADCLVGTHIENNPIECCVSMIEWLIKNNHFSKEYQYESNS